MDHKLAIVIVPASSLNPVEASSLLLERFQKIPYDTAGVRFMPKFRFKRVGGWFDGLSNGLNGKEQWSSVLSKLFDGSFSSASELQGAQSGPEILAQIEADNIRLVSALSAIAPCSVIVTPDGEWYAEGDHSNGAEPAWKNIKAELFQSYGTCIAVCWDISWYFVGEPHASTNIGPVATKHGPSARRKTRSEEWAERLDKARQAFADRQAAGELVKASV